MLLRVVYTIGKLNPRCIKLEKKGAYLGPIAASPTSKTFPPKNDLSGATASVTACANGLDVFSRSSTYCRGSTFSPNRLFSYATSSLIFPIGIVKLCLTPSQSPINSLNFSSLAF